MFTSKITTLMCCMQLEDSSKQSTSFWGIYIQGDYGFFIEINDELLFGGGFYIKNHLILSNQVVVLVAVVIPNRNPLLIILSLISGRRTAHYLHPQKLIIQR